MSNVINNRILDDLQDVIRLAGSPLPDALRPFRVLDTELAALYVGLTSHALRLHRCKRSGPVFVRFGNRVGYRAADLDMWLAALRVEPVRSARRQGRQRATGGEVCG